MFYYFLVLAVLLINLLFSYNIQIVFNRTKKVDLPLIVNCAILWFFSAFRSINIGADTRQYQIVFRLCKEEEWLKLFSSEKTLFWFNLKNSEIGYRFFNKFVSMLWDNPQMITIANSTVLIFLIYKIVKKYSDDPCLSVFMFFTLGFYQLALNLTPSLIASLIVIYGVGYLKEKNLLKYMATIMIASVFHYSAFGFLVLYPLSFIKVNKDRMKKMLITSGTTFWVAFEIVIRIASRYVPDRYLAYLGGNKITVELAVYLVQVILLTFCLYGNEPQEDYTVENWFWLLESLFYIGASHASHMLRIAFLFSPMVIVYIPNLLGESKKMRDRKWMIIIFLVAMYLLRTKLNNIGTTIPYEFFWDIESPI